MISEGRNNMYSIEIDPNESVNPCIITPNGEFTPDFHSILIISDDPIVKQLFSNWYLGTIWIGNRQMNQKIPKNIFSEMITRVSQKVDLIITFSNSSEFAVKISARLAQFIVELKKEIKNYDSDISDIYMSDYSNDQKIIEKITQKLKNSID